MPRERWRKVRRAAGYQVSDRGRVRSVARTLSDGRSAGGVMLTPKIDRDGYQLVKVAGQWVPVHHLVTDEWLGKCPAGMERLHGPGGQQDNSVTNLRFGTHQENEQDKARAEKLDWNGTHRHSLIGTSVTGGAAGE